MMDSNWTQHSILFNKSSTTFIWIKIQNLTRRLRSLFGWPIVITFSSPAVKISLENQMDSTTRSILLQYFVMRLKVYKQFSPPQITWSSKLCPWNVQNNIFLKERQASMQLVSENFALNSKKVLGLIGMVPGVDHIWTFLTLTLISTSQEVLYSRIFTSEGNMHLLNPLWKQYIQLMFRPRNVKWYLNPPVSMSN